MANDWRTVNGERHTSPGGIVPRVVRWLGRSSNRVVQLGVSLIAPRRFLRACYQLSPKPADWKGHRAAFTLSFDVDFQADVEALPALLRLLEQRGIRASFACIGLWIERYPDWHQAIVEAGHELVNHTYTHPDNAELAPDRRFDLLPPAEMRREIVKCHRICREFLGVEPVVFRAPHFGNLHTEQVYPMLQELGYVCSTSTLAVRLPTLGLPFVTPEGIVEVPVSTCPAHPHTVFDTWHCFRQPGGWHREPGEFVALFRWLLETGIETGTYINVYFDPRHCVATPDFGELLAVIEKHEPDVWCCSYAELAAHWRDIAMDTAVSYMWEETS